MKKILISVFLFCLILSLIGCTSTFLYPIRPNIEKQDVAKITYKTKYNYNNLFQFRLNRSFEFLPVSDDNINRGLISDFPIKRFHQDNSIQGEYIKGNTITTEETYLYLDEFNVDKKGEASTKQFGYAFYFITFPTVDKPRDSMRRTLKYFNQPNILYLNIINCVQVGYWMKNGDEILMIFQKSEENVSVYRGIHYRDIVEITEVSHPSKLNKRIKTLEIFKVMKKFNDMRIPIKPTLKFDEKSLDEHFRNIKAQVVFIELKNVLNLNLDKNSNDGLLFIKIPKNKAFLHENKNETFLSIESFKIGLDTAEKKSFYLNLTNSKNTTDYIFKREVIFVK